MKKNSIKKLFLQFDSLIMILSETDIEFCFARDVQSALGYAKWDKFTGVIGKAKQSCETSGIEIEDHFQDVTKTVEIGSGAKRPIKDIMLTRYACYLIAQNGDPRKEPIAFAQSYFALQTRKQELVEERIRLLERLKARQTLKDSEKELSDNIYERGVDNKGFGKIRSRGDAALFAVNSTQAIKDRLNVPKGRPLADYLPTITITAKNLATEITNFNVHQDDLQGERSITTEHVKNNRDVRKLLGKSGIKPEELPPEEDLKKLERRVKSDEKKLSKQAKLPSKNTNNDKKE